MSEAMERTGQVMPLYYVTRLIQDPWLGYGWNWDAFMILAGVTVVASLASLRLFRWE
jgi:hypothetical protein